MLRCKKFVGKKLPGVGDCQNLFDHLT